MLTAGGLAPCLSAAVGMLIERYSEVAPDVELIAYTDGYKGLLSGQHIVVTPEIRASAGTKRPKNWTRNLKSSWATARRRSRRPARDTDGLADVAVAERAACM